MASKAILRKMASFEEPRKPTTTTTTKLRRRPAMKRLQRPYSQPNDPIKCDHDDKMKPIFTPSRLERSTSVPQIIAIVKPSETVRRKSSGALKHHQEPLYARASKQAVGSEDLKLFHFSQDFVPSSELSNFKRVETDPDQLDLLNGLDLDGIYDGTPIDEADEEPIVYGDVGNTMDNCSDPDEDNDVDADQEPLYEEVAEISWVGDNDRDDNDRTRHHDENESNQHNHLTNNNRRHSLVLVNQTRNCNNNNNNETETVLRSKSTTNRRKSSTNSNGTYYCSSSSFRTNNQTQLQSNQLSRNNIFFSSSTSVNLVDSPPLPAFRLLRTRTQSEPKLNFIEQVQSLPPNVPNQLPPCKRRMSLAGAGDWVLIGCEWCKADEDYEPATSGDGSTYRGAGTGSGHDQESLYAEPIYHQSTSCGSSDGSLYNHGKMGSQLKNWSPVASSSSPTSFQEESNYNDSVWSFDQSSSAYSSYGPSAPSSGTFVTKEGPTIGGLRVNGIIAQRRVSTDHPILGPLPPTPKSQFQQQKPQQKQIGGGAIVFNGDKTLPPLPPGQTPGIIGPARDIGKISTIAKSAGRKLAKKLLSIRKPSRADYEQEKRVSSPVAVVKAPVVEAVNASPSLNQQQQQQLDRGRNRYRSLGDIRLEAPVSGGAISRPGSKLSTKRSLSRPNMPPPQPPALTLLPEPPKMPLPPVPGTPSSQGSGMSVYGNTGQYNGGGLMKNVGRNDQFDDDDDFEDSDFYESDTELIRNFVSAVQPIYAMEEEPLYQYYTYGISLTPEDSDYQPVIPKNLGLTLDMLVPRTGQRTLWCQLPEVMSSGILGVLSDKQKQLQEAIFEILTSEVSYLKSLDVLISLFCDSPELNAVLSPEDVECVYGNIVQVKECCQSFLSVLLKKWEQSWYIQEIGQVINEHALTKFGVYKDYCRNKPHQDKTLQRLRITNEDFVTIVKTIEQDPKCQMLRLDSFLMLPMQRITRLPLLVNAVIQRTTSSQEKAKCEEALQNLTNLVIDCNEAARESQDAQDTLEIIEKLELPRHIRPSDLGTFVIKNDFLKNPFDADGTKNGSPLNGQLNWTFRKNKRSFYWLIMFSNYLIIAKRKNSDKHQVVDLVPTPEVQIKPLPNIEGGSKDFDNFFMLHFTNKDSVYFLGARTQAELDRWVSKLEGLRPPKGFRAQATYVYQAQRPDELSFDVGDVIQVTQTQPDGWHFGEIVKSYDGTRSGQGWFPGNYCSKLC